MPLLSTMWSFQSSGVKAVVRSPTRGARSFVFFLLFFFIIVLSTCFGPSFPVTVGVLWLQHINGGGAGPAAVVGKPPSSATSWAFGGCLDPLSSEGGSELLCSLLWSETWRRHQGQVPKLILLKEKTKDWIRKVVKKFNTISIFYK